MGKIDFSIGQPEPVPEEKTILVNVKGRHASAVYRDIITSGSRGIYASFTFDAVWDDLTKIAVFEGSERKIDVELTGESCEVPPEVMEMPTSYLRIGVYGVDGTGSIVIPTVYASVRRIEQGTDPSGEHPAEKTKTLVEKLMEAAQAARDAADEAERLAQSVRDDADAGEFDGADGADGNSIWWTVSLISDASMPGQVYGKIRSSWLKGRSGTPAVHDLVVGPAVGTSGSIVWLYEIDSVAGIYCNLHGIGSIKGAPGDPGADGYAPEVTIEQIDGGHRVTITSAAHPEGESFDVMDGSGGSGTVDDDFSTTSENPVQNKVISYAVATMRGQMIELGNAITAKYTKPSSGIPATDLSASVQERLEPDVLLCVYGTTQSGEIQDALDDGILPVAILGNDYYMYNGYSDSQGHSFIRCTLTDLYRIYCKDNVWYAGSLGIPQLSSATPAALGTASAGSANRSSKADHVHPMPSAADVGAYALPSGGIPATDLAAAVQTSLGKADAAIPAPASPSSAQDLVYLNGAWVAADKLYIVNCTPTALDYSGTMDKTVAQIYAAFQEGKTIVFRVWGGQDAYMDVVSSFNGSDGHAYPSFNAYLVYDSDNALIEIYTGTANDGTRATYGTFVYPLSTSACIPAPATPTTGDFLCWNGSSWAATSLSTWQGGSY